MEQYFIDTNVLWWYLVKSSKYHHEVKLYLDNLIKDIQNTFFINEFVAIEILHLLIKHKGKIGYTIASDLLSDEYPFLTISFDTEDLESLKDILDLLFEYGTNTTIGGRDSSIIYSLKKNDIPNLISSDKAFKSIKAIAIFDPLK